MQITHLINHINHMNVYVQSQYIEPEPVHHVLTGSSYLVSVTRDVQKWHHHPRIIWAPNQVGTKPLLSVSDYSTGHCHHLEDTIYLFVYFFICLFTCLLCPSICLFICLLTPSVCLFICLLTPSVWTLCSLRRISRRGELEWAPISEPIGTEPPRWASADAVGRARGMCRCTEVALLYPTAGESGCCWGLRSNRKICHPSRLKVAIILVGLVRGTYKINKQTNKQTNKQME